MNLLRKSPFCSFFRFFSLNSGAIRLKQSKNCPKNGFLSQRSTKSDRLLADNISENIMTEFLQADALTAVVAEKNNVDMEVVVHQSIDSTNSWSLQQCHSGKTLPFACFAEEQTLGRGRRGKLWMMSAQSDIAMSLSWPFVLSHQQLYLLPLSIALAIVETLENLNLRHVQIKWPNDVYVQGKKIAGVLIETQTVKEKLSVEKVNEKRFMAGRKIAVVIGVGLNYDTSLLLSSLQDGRYQVLAELTDIEREIKMQAIAQKIDRQMVASTLLQHVVSVCQSFQQESNYFLERFRTRYDFCKNKTVEVTLDNNETVSGIALGVNNNAELIVLIDGKERVFNCAEVSVKADV